jgi:hypothetical protein
MQDYFFGSHCYGSLSPYTAFIRPTLHSKLVNLCVKASVAILAVCSLASSSIAQSSGSPRGRVCTVSMVCEFPPPTDGYSKREYTSFIKGDVSQNLTDKERCLVMCTSPEARNSLNEFSCPDEPRKPAWRVECSLDSEIIASTCDGISTSSGSSACPGSK